MIEAPTILCPPIANTLGSEYSTNERRIKCKNNDSQSLLAQAKRVLGEVQIATADLIKSWELFTKTIRDNSGIKKGNLRTEGTVKVSKHKNNQNFRNNTQLKKLKTLINQNLRRARTDTVACQALRQLKDTRRKLIWRLKKEADEAFWGKLLHDAKTNNSAQFWQKINSLTSEWNQGIESYATEEAWTTFLGTHLNETQEFRKGPNNPTNVLKAWTPQYKEAFAQNQEFPITNAQICKRISKGRRESAPGPNGIPPILFKQEPEYWAAVFRPMFEKILQSSTIPPSWRGAIISPIFKKGGRNDPRSYRLIALLDNEAKYYAGLLLQELTSWVEDTTAIPYNQTSFCKNMGTTTNILALSLLIDSALAAKQPLYLCYIDYSSAFDHVNRNLLWQKLKKLKIPLLLLNQLILLHSDTWVQVKLGAGKFLSREIPTTQG